MADWRKLGKMSAAGTAVAATIVASGYGIADAAAPGILPFHHAKQDARVVRGTVTSVGTGSFTIARRHQEAETILTTAATRYHEPGTRLSPAGVAVGETVVVYLAVPRHHRPTPTTSTTVTPATASLTAYAPPAPTPQTAAVVDIQLLPDAGKVTAADGSTITLAGGHGKTRTVDVTPATTYFEGGKATSASAVTPGDFVVAWVDPAAPGTPLDAVVVDVFPPPPPTTTSTSTTSTTSTTITPATDRVTSTPPAHKPYQAKVSGVVTSVTGSDIVVVKWGDRTLTITTTGSTLYFEGKTAAIASAVTRGARIVAAGTWTPSATPGSPGTFTATTVEILPTPGPKKPHVAGFGTVNRHAYTPIVHSSLPPGRGTGAGKGFGGFGGGPGGGKFGGGR